ncbi:hypothetical protein OGAPHI_006682 [Ogataea philodendri]|uniref:Rab-GAP TBC domain-containing protein n=1 Tax=Ogataea philodendri TaxID=1378263 RepID=A0A9P8NWY4_9ASCO|nr:uncharacterized protein OGAPHI_006682 [Ogataea philodendri]KAH3661275.1 hypothetical protein OGAPHI_006682 [Ogataea philodendri]
MNTDVSFSTPNLVEEADDALACRNSDGGYRMIDYYVENRREEPFTLVEPPNRKTLTRTESIASLKKSRTSLEQVQTKIGEQIHQEPNRLNAILASDRDRYGFRKANHYVKLEDYNGWWIEYAPYLARRKKKWAKLMAKNGLLVTKNGSPTRFPPRSEELRRYVRKGIPAEWRGNAWFFFARGHDKLKDNKGVYDKLVEETMDMINENTEAIEKDLHRTFPENVHFNNITQQGTDQESALLQTLRRVLKCFSKYKPTIGYCQSLNFIAGLLLIFLDEERAFWMLVIITERYLPGIHEFNLEGVNVHQGVLMLCLRQYLPNVWSLMHETSHSNNNSFLYELPTLSFCTTSWFMSIFVGVMPIETTLRVWDCLFYEDSKAIFQVSLAIFKILEPQMLELGSIRSDDDGILSAELFQLIQNSPKRLLNANVLMQECFRFSSFSKLSQEEVQNCKKYVVESRTRYNELIKRRSAVGMDEQERRELMKSAVLPENKQIGLKSMNWNGRLNNRMRRIQQRIR